MSKKRYSKIGLSPGTLVHTGERKSEEVHVTVIEYDEDNFEEHQKVTTEVLKKFRENNKTAWINIDGLHDVNLIGEIGETFSLHHLLLEDVLQTNHRPKAEEYDDCLFLSLKMLSLGKHKDEIISEQLSFILGKKWLLTFQERQGDIFSQLRLNISENKGRVRKKKNDYLFYRLLDTVVDNYFLVSDYFEEKIEHIEDGLIKGSDDTVPKKIQLLKKQIIHFRKDVRPLKDAVAHIIKEENSLIDDTTKTYLNDVHDHLVQIHDFTEIHRENLTNLMDFYLSGLSNRMNQVMKFLTVITTIFIPLSFIAGLYGMNFKYMPELNMENGYFIILGVMAVVVIAMLAYFTIKKWWK